MTAGSGGVVRPSAASGPDPVPRDDRAWPRGATVVSLLVGLAAVATAVGLEIGAAHRGGPAMVAIPAGFVVAFATFLALNVAGMRAWLLGHPFPAGLRLLALAGLGAGFAVLFWYDGPVGGAILAGLTAGVTFSNPWAIRVARRNRPLVDAAEAEMARVAADSEQEPRRAPAARGTPAGRSAPVGRVLRDTVATERRRALGWLLAGVIVTSACVALIRGERPDPPEPLTSRPPHPSDEVMVEPGRADKSYLAVLGWRVVGLATVAALFSWLL
jgi:hypothetical protein